MDVQKQKQSDGLPLPQWPIRTSSRAFPSGVAKEEQEQHIGRGDEHAVPELELWEEEAQRDGGPEELCKVGRDDGDFGEDVEGVKGRPAVEERVARTAVEEEAAVGGKVWEQRVRPRTADGTHIETPPADPRPSSLYTDYQQRQAAASTTYGSKYATAQTIPTP
ncbi:hypothetical protein H0H87_005817, partial [Tephrocybe sp. NHM501043]